VAFISPKKLSAVLHLRNIAALFALDRIIYIAISIEWISYQPFSQDSTHQQECSIQVHCANQ